MTDDPELAGQTVVVLGGSSGIGLETARRARAEGANVILTAREPERLYRVGLELGAKIAAFDVNDAERLTDFFGELRASIDHLLVSGGGPDYVPFADLDTAGIRRGVERIVLSMRIAVAAKALELAPIRVNLIAPGFVDTPLSASLLGGELDARRAELRATLPIRRVVGPADVAALAVELMSNTAVTGATFDIDGGQQLVEL